VTGPRKYERFLLVRQEFHNSNVPRRRRKGTEKTTVKTQTWKILSECVVVTVVAIL
jgi:hypothetical protein